MTDSDDVRGLITHIRMIDGEMRKLEAYRAALGTLWADCPYPEHDFGVAGCAWRLDSALIGVGWSDVLRNAMRLETALGVRPETSSSPGRPETTA
jgi:hypothetical protein